MMMIRVRQILWLALIAAFAPNLAYDKLAAAGSDINARLAVADIDHGRAVFQRCIGCHRLENGGANLIGPNLYGVVDGPVGDVEGFQYSLAMSASTLVWTAEVLDKYLDNPTEFLPSTKMAYTRTRNPQDRADVIAFMKAVSSGLIPPP